MVKVITVLTMRSSGTLAYASVMLGMNNPGLWKSPAPTPNRPKWKREEILFREIHYLLDSSETRQIVKATGPFETTPKTAPILDWHGRWIGLIFPGEISSRVQVSQEFTQASQVIRSDPYHLGDVVSEVR